MPRFLLETEADAAAQLAATRRLANQRFPEIAVEDRAVAGGLRDHAYWVCRAPSEAHIGRWAEAIQLTVISVQPIHQGGPEE